jgi:lysylphosphatidylglycerol synthetase-like protein (DUF2156 family)
MAVAGSGRSPDRMLPLIRRSRRAWRLAAGLLGLSVVLHLARGPHYAAATVTGLMAVALIARRDDFPFHGDPAARPSALLRLAGGLAFALGYGLVADWAYRVASDLPFSFASALADTARAMGGQPPREIDLLPAEFATWFPLSVLSIAAIAIARAAAVWLRPWQRSRRLSGTAKTTPSTNTTPTPAASPAGRRRSSPIRSSPRRSPTNSSWNGVRRSRGRSGSR